MTERYRWSGHGYVLRDEAYAAFVAWAEAQDDLPDDEDEAIDAYEAYLAGRGER